MIDPIILALVAFISGVLTVLAPCILPLLPVIVGGSIAGGVNRTRAYVVCASLGVSVIVFTLALKVSSTFIGIPQEVWQWVSGGILIALGFATIFPALWEKLPFLGTISVGSNRVMTSGYMKQSFMGDVVVGAALGPVFTTCSPTYFVILATVLPAEFFMGLVDLLIYTAGLTLTLLLIAIVGQRFVDRLGLASDPRGWFRRSMGALFIIIGISIFSGTQQTIESWVLSHVFDITTIEQKLLRTKNTVTAIAPAPVSAEAIAKSSGLTSEQKSAIYPKSAELVAPDGYINTDGKPITIGEFKGKKVVLVDIWTYSCINCQRTLPYVKDWYSKYADKGLEIIGVHTPEFAFEKLQKNVQNAVADEGIAYPVILDNEYKTWNAFGNQYWPRKYLVDIDGYIVYDHAGEGDYDVAEKAIQKALAERAHRLGIDEQTDLPLTHAAGASADDLRNVQSPETYFGSSRNDLLGNGSPWTAGDQTLIIPSSIKNNTAYLSGTWNFQPEFAKNKSAGAEIKYHYDARSVYFVASADSAVRIKVTRDGGKSLGDARGTDVDTNGEATIQANRLYKLIEDTEYGAHTLEIKVEGGGLEAYTFTFG